MTKIAIIILFIGLVYSIWTANTQLLLASILFGAFLSAFLGRKKIG